MQTVWIVISFLISFIISKISIMSKIEQLFMASSFGLLFPIFNYYKKLNKIVLYMCE